MHKLPPSRKASFLIKPLFYHRRIVSLWLHVIYHCDCMSPIIVTIQVCHLSLWQYVFYHCDCTCMSSIIMTMSSIIVTVHVCHLSLWLYVIYHCDYMSSIIVSVCHPYHCDCTCMSSIIMTMSSIIVTICHLSLWLYVIPIIVTVFSFQPRMQMMN